MNCVERITEYGRLQAEGPLKCANDPSRAWPYSGRVAFEGVRLRYGESPSWALDGASFEARPGEKVGVVGRTGAGKSSLVSALLAAHPLAEGAVFVDGVCVSVLGLETVCDSIFKADFQLRGNVALIPQDSVMFTGTIRDNLDPGREKMDADLWSSLQRVGLFSTGTKESPRKEKYNLDAAVEQGGANFSSGERQLISLARAFVKGSRLVIMDEATSAVDHSADALIRTVIQSELAHTTLLCIAHRIETILYFDQVVVMERGKVVESGSPLDLFDSLGSEFYAQCRSAVGRCHVLPG